MKNMLIAVSATALLSVSSVSFANNANVGCGLGSMIIKDQSSTAMQVLAVTTNGTSSNQTLGITSGTLGCAAPARLVMNDQAQKFVAENMDGIAVDLAAGKGENLDTLLSLIEVEDKAAASAVLKSNFASIYTSSDVTSAQVIDNIIAVL